MDSACEAEFLGSKWMAWTEIATAVGTIPRCFLLHRLATIGNESNPFKVNQVPGNQMFLGIRRCSGNVVGLETTNHTSRGYGLLSYGYLWYQHPSVIWRRR